MMTTRELMPALGQTVNVRMESLTVLCKVNDAKNSYGRQRFLVSPVAGNGSQWVEIDRITAVPTSPADVQPRIGV